MKTPILTKAVVTLLTMVFGMVLLPGCGGGSSGSSGSSESAAIPANITVADFELSAGVPTTITVTLPKPPDPYTEVTLDLGRTLEEANITVTPQ